jgi:hypothetical protein
MESYLLQTGARCIEFSPHYVPTTFVDPSTHDTLTQLLQQRIQLDNELENWLDDIAPDGSRLDPDRDLQPNLYCKTAEIDAINKKMLTVYVEFLTPKRTGRIKSTERIPARQADARRELAPYDQATRDRTAKRAAVEAENVREEQARQRLASAIQNSKSPATNASDL